MFTTDERPCLHNPYDHNVETLLNFPASGYQQLKAFNGYLYPTSTLNTFFGLRGTTLSGTVEEVEKIARKIFEEIQIQVEALTQQPHSLSEEPQLELRKKWDRCTRLFSALSFFKELYLQRYAGQPHPGKEALEALYLQYQARWLSLAEKCNTFYSEKEENIIDSWVLLPMPEEDSTVNFQQHGWIKTIRDSWITSGEANEIDWKIDVYYAMLEQLSTKVLPKFNQALCEAPNESEIKKSLLHIKEILTEFQSLWLTQRVNSLGYLEKLRSLYAQQLLPALRRAINLAKNCGTEELALVVATEDLSLYLFTEMSLSKELKNLINKFDSLGESILLSSSLGALGEEKQTLLNTSNIESREGKKQHRMLARVGQQRKHIVSVPRGLKITLPRQWLSSAYGASNIEFDGALEGNPVHVLYTLQLTQSKDPLNLAEKALKNLAFGSPTHEYLGEWSYSILNQLGYTRPDSGCEEAVGINPEFIGFLQAYRRRGMRHLYISLQSLITAPFGDETGRSSLLMALADAPDMEETLYLCVLSKNSPFYFQSPTSYPDEMDVTTFTKLLYSELFNKPSSVSGNYVSKGLRKGLPDLEGLSTNLIESIAKLFFPDTPFLSRKQRQNFIELFYNHITFKLLEQLDIASFNISCKDAIDRAAAANAQLFAEISIINGEHNEQDNIDFFELLMNGRAPLVRQRAIDHGRLARAEQCVEFLLDNAVTTKELFALLHPTLTIRNGSI